MIRIIFALILGYAAGYVVATVIETIDGEIKNGK